MRDEGGPFGFGDQELIPSYRKLLAFIKQNSPAVNPALDAVFAKAGI